MESVGCGVWGEGIKEITGDDVCVRSGDQGNCCYLKCGVRCISVGGGGGGEGFKPRFHIYVCCVILLYPKLRCRAPTVNFL